MRKLIFAFLILGLVGCGEKVEDGKFTIRMNPEETIKKHAHEPNTDGGWGKDESTLTFGGGNFAITTTEPMFMKYVVEKRQCKNVRLTEDKENFYIELIPRRDE